MDARGFVEDTSWELDSEAFVWTTAQNVAEVTADTSASTGGKDDYFDYFSYKRLPEYRAAEILVVYFSPLLMLVGTVGNVLAGVVVVRSKILWKRTSSLHILMLAVADTLLLDVCLLDLFLVFLDINMRNLGQAACKLVFFVIYFLQAWEAWIIVNMSIESLVVVYMPHQSRFLFTKRRVILGLCFTTLVIAALNLVYRITRTYISTLSNGVLFWYCQIDPRYTGILETWYWVEITMLSAAPFVLMVLCCMLIVSRIIYSNIQQRRMQVTSDIKVSGMTITMLAVALVFLLLTGPVSVVFVFVTIFYEDPNKTYEEADRLFNIALALNFFGYVNNVTNLYIYCVSDPTFRKELKVVLCGK